MFDRATRKTPTTESPTTPVVGDLGVVIHTLPKEFYDREIKAVEDDKPVALKALPAPAPAPVPVAQALPPVAKMAAPRPKRRRGILVLSSLLLLAGLGAAAYAYVSTQSAQTEAPTTPVVPIPTPTPTPTPTPVPTPEPDDTPVIPTSGVDTDSDGLTNVEEILYGTELRNPDTDGDTFLDGNEVFHRYDPLGLAPSTLLDTRAVRVLESAELPFVIFYPTSWNALSTPMAQRVSFRSPSTAAVNVLWQDKAADLSLEDWYIANVGEVPLDRLQPLTTKEGYASLTAPDERVMYVNAGTQVYTLMYDLVDAKSIDFLQTFKMMANSFKLVP